MIIFLDFAPIEFMGGAEKWMIETARKINKKEKTHLVSVDSQLANIYGRLVLKRNFDSRSNINYPQTKIDFKSLIFGSSDYKNIKKLFNNSRIIYSRYELPEILIIYYYSGISGIRKTVFGLHSPFIYKVPESIIQHLHNAVYTSYLSKLILSGSKKIHVLNKRDEVFLKENFSLNNVVRIPNGIPSVEIQNTSNDKNKLRVLFVGELSTRKGADIVLDIAANLPAGIDLTIVGDGPMEDEFRQISGFKSNVMYKGYMQTMEDIYKNNDILILPSRAESMPLVILEALSYGLIIVDSSNISLDLDTDIEHSVGNLDYQDYIKTLESLYEDRANIDKSKIVDFFKNNFLDKKIDAQLKEKIFN